MKIVLIALSLALLAASPLFAQESDTALCNHIFSYAFEHKLIEKPIAEITSAIAQRFIGKPYEANTLDKPDREILVTNLHSFDCVTLIENVLALARCVRKNLLSFDAYAAELRYIRYRGGKLNGYTSRLHYFGEWVYDNDRKGVVQNVSRQYGGIDTSKKIDFMTTHRKSYRKLAADSLYNAIAAVEKSLAGLDLLYVPKDKISSIERLLHDGDVIAFTTSVKGLDVSHTGFAIHNASGELHLLHAPDVGDTVKISQETLSAYVGKNPKNSGIIIARPVDIIY